MKSLPLPRNWGNFQEIDGQRINIIDNTHLISSILRRLDRGGSFLVCTLNLDHLVKRRVNKAFQEAYAKAEFVTADGFPIVMFARLAGCGIEQTTGSDVIEPLCGVAADLGISVFLIGSTLETLCKSAKYLVSKSRDLDIRGVFAPPMGFEVDSAIATESIELIKNSGARICFVGLGAPLQERLGARAIEQTSDMAFVCIGAGLDFLAGSQVRCPKYVRRARLEWAWRLALNPRRFGPRYWLCGKLFAKLLVQALWRFVLLSKGRVA